MTAAKSERLLNLLIALLVSRQPLTKERLRQAIEGYQGSTEEAFEKMFERDKEELRALGVPIELESLDRFFDDEQGYRIQRDAFELPEVDLAPDEAAAVGLAARVWQHAGLADATSQALLKLRAGGVDVDRAAIDFAQPALVVEEPAFDAFWHALSTRTPVRFDYRRGTDVRATTRHLQPWGVVTSRGRWYVVGHDTDRDAPRLFRLSRVQGEVASTGAPGSYAVPEGIDVRALAAGLAPAVPDREAVLAIRTGQAHELRRRAVAIAPDPQGPDGDVAHWEVARVPYGDPDAFAADVLAQLDAVRVREPAELADLVQARLRALLEETA